MFERLFNGLDRLLVYKLVAFQIFVIALSNWIVSYHFNVFGTALSYAAFTFPLIVVATDLTVRMIGKEMGRTVVTFSFIPAILISMLIVKLSGAPDEVAIRIGLGSGCAYAVSTMLDVYVFSYFREKYTQWWIAPTFASIITMIIDTYTFYYVAFAGVAGSVYEHNWFSAAASHSITKIIVSLVVILPTYGILLAYLQKKLSTMAKELEEEIKNAKNIIK
jgi:uncharacterized PurR-regulated membrane protein YhhQ (DUF165 family)